MTARLGYPTLAIALVSLVACGKTGLSDSECRTEAAALTKLLREANVDPPQFFSEAKLVVRNELPRVQVERRAVDLVLEPGATRLQYRLIDSAATLAEELATARQTSTSKRIYLLIDVTTPWQQVVEAVTAAEGAGLTSPVFVFRAEVKLTPPPRNAIDTELDAIEKDEAGTKATKVAKLVEREVARCPAVQKTFGSVGGVDVEDKAKVLIEGLGEGLVECKCRANIGALRSAMWRILANPTPHRVLALDNTGAKATRIALPAKTPWSEASKRFTADLTSAALEVQAKP